MPDDSTSPNDPQSIPLFDSETPRVSPDKKEVTLSHDLNEKLLLLSTEADALKSFVKKQMFAIKKSLQDIQEHPYKKEINDEYVVPLNANKFYEGRE